ncbi:MAG: CDP-alcohol phosphatidyltransferase family protein [Bacteroidales bacterium]|nr:CDP-alcohol phosphatidyltransferase family protein [Bacteroidales bacterium]
MARNRAIASISSERKRTNILRKVEQNTIAFLVQRIPLWLTSNMLTAIGLFGNLLVCLSFLLAAYINKYYLLLSTLGFVINWFGDSLDGRIAYYRKIPRKWYGFMLDLTTDWIGVTFIGLGFLLYIDHKWILVGYGFITLYGWSIIIAILRYNVTGKYTIDSGLFGPTEVRIAIAFVLIIEVIFSGSIVYLGLIAVLALFVVNILDFKKLLRLADKRDEKEKIKLNETD